MQKYQQVILFTLFITICYAKPKINSFNTTVDLGPLGIHSTIFAYSIQLWAGVTECPSSCLCKVTTNGAEDDARPLTFPSGKEQIGYVMIEELQPDTMYSFRLTCEAADEPAIDTITPRTDYGHPSPPQNITTSLDSEYVKISWAIPKSPAGPINNYKLTIDKKPAVENIPADEYSYRMPEKYVYGTRHTFKLAACNKNKHGGLVCTNQNDLPEVNFFAPTPATTIQPQATVTITPTQATVTITPTQTTTRSTGVHSYSLSVLLVLFSFLSLQ